MQLAGAIWTNGEYIGLGSLGYYWSAAQASEIGAGLYGSGRDLYIDDSRLNTYNTNGKHTGLTVRCVYKAVGE